MAASKTYTFSPSTTAASAQVNQNFDDCINAINTNTPAGIIMLWSGSVAAIPTGWLLCNGSSGTPDLRNKFVVGAGSAYAVAAVGGADSVTLDITQIPPHSHDNDTNDNSGSTLIRRGSAGNTGNVPTKSAGGGLSHENRPPYYALCFIMKL